MQEVKSWRKSRRRLDLSVMPIHRNVAVEVTAFPMPQQRSCRFENHILSSFRSFEHGRPIDRFGEQMNNKTDQLELFAIVSAGDSVAER